MLTVANLVPVKGIEVLIYAIRNLKLINEEVILIVVGDDKNEYGSNLKKLVSESRLEKVILFTGKRYDLNRIYNASDIFVLPTHQTGRAEGCPVALLEAMSTGLPVIASNIPGSRDILEDFQDYLFEPGNHEALTKKIKSILSLDKYQTSVLGNSMRNHIEKKFDIRYEVNKTERVYKKIYLDRKQTYF